MFVASSVKTRRPENQTTKKQDCLEAVRNRPGGYLAWPHRLACDQQSEAESAVIARRKNGT
jgi:hypothetical protein